MKVQKHYNYNDAHAATIREIDKQNSTRAYSGWKSRIIAHAKMYKKTIDDKHFIYEKWTVQQCIDNLCNNDKYGLIVKRFDKQNRGTYE